MFFYYNKDKRVNVKELSHLSVSSIHKWSVDQISPHLNQPITVSLSNLKISSLSCHFSAVLPRPSIHPAASSLHSSPIDTFASIYIPAVEVRWVLANHRQSRAGSCLHQPRKEHLAHRLYWMMHIRSRLRTSYNTAAPQVFTIVCRCCKCYCICWSRDAAQYCTELYSILYWASISRVVTNDLTVKSPYKC